MRRFEQVTVFPPTAEVVEVHVALTPEEYETETLGDVWGVVEGANGVVEGLVGHEKDACPEMDLGVFGFQSDEVLQIRKGFGLFVAEKLAFCPLQIGHYEGLVQIQSDLEVLKSVFDIQEQRVHDSPLVEKLGYVILGLLNGLLDALHGFLGPLQLA